MNTAIVFISLVGVCVGQVIPLTRYIQPTLRISQPVVHLAQPVLRVAQPLSTVDPRRPIAIVSQSADRSDDGSFSYGFESANGIKASAAGSVRILSPEEQAQVVQGSFSYTAPDGTTVSRTYVADENGFRAEGADLPTPPPIPEAIARSLEVLPRLSEEEQLTGQQRPLVRRA